MQRSGIWYKVRHPMFDANLAYQAVDYQQFSPDGWAYIVFILPSGHTWAARQDHCTALPPDYGPDAFDAWDYTASFSRPMMEREKAFPWAEKPEIKNPDLVNMDR